MRIPLLFPAGCLALLLAAVPAAAETAATPAINARAGVHADFNRLVFDWPHLVPYRISRTGDRVTVTFGAPGEARFDGEFKRLTRARDFTTAPDKDGDMTVSFIVAPKAELKDFLSDKSVVIDIRGPAAPNAEAANAGTGPEKPVKTEAKTTEKPKASPPPQPAPAKTEAKKAAPLPSPPPLAPLPLTPTAKKAEAAAPAPAALAPPPAAATANFTAQDITATPLLVASLDPQIATRAAIYLRAGYGYIVFDRKFALDVNALTAGQPAPRVTLEPLDLPDVSGFRFAVPGAADISATRQGTAWQIFLTRQEPEVPVSTSLVAQPDFALGARYLLPLPDAPEPVHLIDPVVGDELILVPLKETEAFGVKRRMADFQILPAAQGLVIKPLIDKLTVRDVTDGVEITTSGGLHLSSTADTGASQSSRRGKIASAGKSIFDFTDWRGKPGETFTDTRQRLQQTIVDVPEAERNRARLELARFYFAHGNGEEAVGLLQYLAKQVPDLTAHADFQALLGASEILAYRPDEGLKSLDIPALAGQQEIELWQAVADADLRNWQEAEEKFALTESMLDSYPEPFYSHFSVLAIESALAMNKDHEAADWLDRLENNPHASSVNPAIAYLHGVLYAKAGKAASAEAAWKKADASDDRLYKIRAELALIDLGVANGSLTPAQAADRLEALRFGWRGDDLEMDILHRLGQFYIQAKNVKAGLNVLARAVQLYPDSPMTPQIRTEMSGIFRDIFLGNLGKGLSPLDALTLYQQYRDLMPSGPDGVAVTKNLAERLVDVDLLDQAGSLLEDLVKNRLQGEDQISTSTRLAAIRLLDHEPAEAITALDYVKDQTIPAADQAKRVLLRAKALSDMHQDDQALALLNGDNSQDAKKLRADICMHAQHWSDAAKALLDLVGPPPKAGVALTHDQAEWLVNAAIALSLAGDSNGLDKLAIDFGAAMKPTPENDTFRMLTQPEQTTQPGNIAAAESRIADVDMFQGFLNSYRKEEKAQDKGMNAAPAKP